MSTRGLVRVELNLSFAHTSKEHPLKNRTKILEYQLVKNASTNNKFLEFCQARITSFPGTQKRRHVIKK
jgi:hypothetical protein